MKIYRCPHCKKPLKISRIPQYDLECLDCNEKFFVYELTPEEILFLHCAVNPNQPNNQQGVERCHT